MDLRQKNKNLKNDIPPFNSSHFFLERPRIHELLKKAAERPAVLVCAGAGYGKTYAVNSFLKSRQETVVWMQLSQRDNQPWRFWENYSRAVGNCREQAGKDMRETGFPQTARQFEQWFEINRREFGRQGKYFVVGDDFHLIKSKAVLDFLERALRFPVPGHTLVLISRREPDLNIMPLLAKGRLARIDAEELLFTREEIAEYFSQRKINLTEEETAAIHHDTEGWPLAMEIAAIEIQKSGGSYSRLALEEGALKIFEDDLFVSVSEDIQKFLIAISLFEQWPLELLERCISVLPQIHRNIPYLLAEMDKIAALVRYDCYLRGFRIHRLFLDYLREKQNRLSAEEIKTVCRSAAHWCLENNLKMDAAINFERSGDYEGLAGIIDSFPRVVPVSAAAQLCEITGRLVSRAPGSENDEIFIFLQRVAQGRLLMCLSRFDEAAALFNENIRLFETLPSSPFNSRVLAESWNYMGIMAFMKCLLKPDDTYIFCLEKANFYYERHPWPLPAVMTFCSIGTYVAQVGFNAAAGEFERRVKFFADNIARLTGALNGDFSGMGDLASAELFLFRGELNKAEQSARKAVIKAREKKQYEAEHRAYFFLLRICLYHGAPEELQQIIKQKDALAANSDYLDGGTINDIIDGWLYAQLGIPQKAASWLHSRFNESGPYLIFRNYESLVKAKCLYAEKKFDEAIAFLDMARKREGLASYLLGMIEINCLEAAAHFHLGDEKTALTLLEEAYKTASPHSLNMPFIELGYEMRSLAGIAYNEENAALQIAIPRAWLDEIRSHASAYGKNLSAAAEQLRGIGLDGLPNGGKNSRLSVYLTRQEYAVLNGLSRGQTREEIAAAAGQPLSGVKTLISRICEKLGAVNRADAIRIALGMGILE
jgi:LuxR family maltose regulon positive regulatory protein